MLLEYYYDQAAALMKLQWEATWPNDAFVAQLLRYEDDLRK